MHSANGTVLAVARKLLKKPMKKRSRIVSFRLSDEEYDSLKNVTATRGARSVSEFTRSVACNEGSSSEGSESIGDSLRRFNVRMEELVHRLETLTEAIETKNATNSPDFTKSEEKESNL
jgi:uncharacterized protein (DUF1778 family)